MVGSNGEVQRFVKGHLYVITSTKYNYKTNSHDPYQWVVRFCSKILNVDPHYRFKLVAYQIERTSPYAAWNESILDKLPVSHIQPDELLMFMHLPFKTALWDEYFMGKPKTRKRPAKRSWHVKHERTFQGSTPL